MATTAENADVALAGDKYGNRERVAAGLRRRHAAEARFRAIGLAAIVIGLGFVALLFASILSKGLPAFWQAAFQMEVYLDPEIIDVPERPVQQAGQSNAEFQQELQSWQRRLAFINWNSVLTGSLAEIVPEAADNPRDAAGMFANQDRIKVRDMVAEDPSLIGQRVDMQLFASANVDNWLKGNIDRSLPQSQQQLSALQQQWADDLYEQGVITMAFSSALFTNPDSRSSPATAGLAGAFVGSLYMMLIVLFVAVPIGVLAAVYLEEFAPKNRITDFIEVNINNLAAVPSIVFGLLGASIFINWFGLPLSAPLVGGLVLSLMTLPTVIIASRAALRAVPPSIRQAALGVGASPMQAMFHHTLPMAIPGMLTGAIIGIAQALGETAPLLLIGMKAFVASVPADPMQQSTALPVQIYLWSTNENRNFFEARTSAAIIVLLALMIMLNALAIFLRHRFERRW